MDRRPTTARDATLRKWLIHSPDGVHRGPVTTVDLARAVRSGVLPPAAVVSPADGPRDWRPASAVREIQMALADLAMPETHEDEAVLRTMVASPADLAAVEEAPDSMAALRPFGRGSMPATEEVASEDDVEAAPDSEPRTLIAPSPFEDVDGGGPDEIETRMQNVVAANPQPIVVVPAQVPVPAARPAAGRPAGQVAVGAPVGPEFGFAATVKAPVVVERPYGPPGQTTSAGLAQAKANKSKHRLFMVVAFAGGLLGGLVILGLVYAIVGRQ